MKEIAMFLWAAAVFLIMFYCGGMCGIAYEKLRRRKYLRQKRAMARIKKSTPLPKAPIG